MDASPDRYSGFGIRLGALLIGAIVVNIAGGTIGVVLMGVLGLVFATTGADSAGVSGEISDQAATEMVVRVAATVIVVAVVVTVLRVLYFMVFTGLRGQTPGKMLVGIKVVNAAGNVPGVRRAFMREVIGKLVSGLVVNAGFLWVLRDAQRQAWHDKIAETYVVSAREREGRSGNISS